MEMRPLKPEDMENVRRIAKDSFDKLWSEKDFGFFLEHPQGKNFACIIEAQLVGYVLALFVQGDLDIIAIAVAPSARRKGVGRHLMNHLISAVVPTRVYLEVESSNEAALALYRNLGLKIYGVRKKYYAGIKDAILMKAQS